MRNAVLVVLGCWILFACGRPQRVTTGEPLALPAGDGAVGPAPPSGPPPVVSVCQDDLLQGATNGRIAWTGSEWGIFFHFGDPSCPAYVKVDKDGRRRMEPVSLVGMSCSDDIAIIDADWRDGAFDVVWRGTVPPGADGQRRMELEHIPGLARIGLDGKVIEPWRPLVGVGIADANQFSASHGVAFNPTGFAVVRDPLSADRVDRSDNGVSVAFYDRAGKLLHQETLYLGTHTYEPSLHWTGTAYLISFVFGIDPPASVKEGYLIALWSPTQGLLWKHREEYPGPLARNVPEDDRVWAYKSIPAGDAIIDFMRQDGQPNRAMTRRRSLKTGLPLEKPVAVPNMRWATPSLLLWTGHEIAVHWGGGLARFRRFDRAGKALSTFDQFVDECVARDESTVSDIAWTGDRYGICTWSSYRSRYDEPQFEPRPAEDGGVYYPPFDCPHGWICNEKHQCMAADADNGRYHLERYPNLVLVPSSPLEIGPLEDYGPPHPGYRRPARPAS